MKQEIKFRGKRLDNGEWIFGSLFNFEGECEIADCNTIDYSRYDVDPSSVDQYTRLKDKNGKEIYEGDIVCLGDTKRRTGVIVRSETEPAFVLEVNDTDFDLYYRNQHRYEVVGNIHDTPELLKTVRHE